MAGSLQRKRADLEKQIQALDSQLSGLVPGPSGAGPAPSHSPKPGRKAGGKRGAPRGPRKGNTLGNVIHGILQGKVLSLSEIEAGVRKSSYPSKSPNLRVMISQALMKQRGRFRKVKRGHYTAK